MAKGLSEAELEAVLETIGQITAANGSYELWKERTGKSKTEWNALLRGEDKLRIMLIRKRLPKRLA